ncbi:MAG: hypothetical protein ACK53L_31795, partial [Pirellulaceae bacterium]
PTWKDHHFWALDIGGVMGAGNIANNQTVTEDLEIGFYANSQIELKDPTSGEIRALFSSQARPALGRVPLRGVKHEAQIP